MKYGIKLWSTNTDWFEEARDRHSSGEFDFVELYTVPGSFDTEKLQFLKEMPVGLHAPHDIDFVKDREENFDIWKEVSKFSDFFDPEYIVIHPGFGDDQKTLYKNLDKIDTSRVLIENMPYEPISGEEPLYGHTYKMIKDVLSAFDVGFCLDFGHAIKSATTQGINHYDFIEKLTELKPSLFHIVGGNTSVEHDEHLNLEEGDFNIKKIKKIVKRSNCKKIVFETPKEDGLTNDIHNIEYFKSL